MSKTIKYWRIGLHAFKQAGQPSKSGVVNIYIYFLKDIFLEFFFSEQDCSRFSDRSYEIEQL